MQAIILAVGDELVLGQTVDTNSMYLSAQLARHGIATVYHRTVGDDQQAIAEAIRAAAGKAQVIIVTGGLGPTEDDLTRQGLASAMETPLIQDAASVERIESYFASRGRTPSENNLLQALHPEGSSVIENTCGTAPGIMAQIGSSTVYVTPGVPMEMRKMFSDSIAPNLWGDREQDRSSKHYIRSMKVNTFGMGESLVAQNLGELMARGRNPQVGTTVTDGIISVRVRSSGHSLDDVEAQLADTVREVEGIVGPLAFGHDEQALQDDLVAMLVQKNMTVATAESCTGGLIGKLLTEVSGSSQIYPGGWVTYSNQMKMSQLNVPAELIESHGAVSEPVACAMAQGACCNSGADLAAGVTGIAGPGGGTKEKPVGTVWIGLAHRGTKDVKEVKVESRCLQLGGNRAMIRDRAAKYALQFLRFHLLGLSMDALLQPASEIDVKSS